MHFHISGICMKTLGMVGEILVKYISVLNLRDAIYFVMYFLFPLVARH